MNKKLRTMPEMPAFGTFTRRRLLGSLALISMAGVLGAHSAWAVDTPMLPPRIRPI
jgi:hypothetical protein